MAARYEALEREVRSRADAGDVRGAAGLAIQGLGPDLMGFLVALARDTTEAGDAFADLCVRLWKSLAGFRWDSTLWTWSHVLARRALYAQRQHRAAWGGRHVPLSDVADLDELIARVRTTSLAHVKLERRTRAERLRARLPEEDRELLILRVDRGLEWREIARVLADEGEAAPAALDDEALSRASAGLRKRFERLRDRLRELAADEPE